MMLSIERFCALSALSIRVVELLLGEVPDEGEAGKALVS